MDKDSNKKCFFLIYLVLILADFAVFYQVYGFKFINFDDPAYVSNNSNIQSGITFQSVKWAFTTGSNGNWHPLTWLSHMFDWQLYRDNAGGHHITNLLFHIANTLLLFIVLVKMTNAQWPSAFVAALFALHPLHIESVVWIAERKDVLSTFFWLLAMWAYVRFAGRPKLINYLLVVAFFVLGLMSKPMLVTLPFVFLLLDYWPLARFPLIQAVDKTDKQKNKKNTYQQFQKHTFLYLVKEKIPFFIISVASCVITFFVQHNEQAVVTLTTFPVKYRILNAITSYASYMEKMFWPAGLAFFYPNPGPNISFAYVAISALVLLVVTVLVLVFAAKHRYLVMGWFWYVGTLIPVIGLVQVGSQAMADRYTYIPLTGLFIIIAWGLTQLLSEIPNRKILLGISSSIVLLILSVLTFIDVGYWKNTMTLCQRALKVTKENSLANLGMGKELFEQNRINESITYYLEAIRITPNNVQALNDMGVSLCYNNRVDEAVSYFQKAIELDPQNASAQNNIGIAFAMRKEYDKAITHFNQALQINPFFTGAKDNLIQAQCKKQELQNYKKEN